MCPLSSFKLGHHQPLMLSMQEPSHHGNRLQHGSLARSIKKPSQSRPRHHRSMSGRSLEKITRQPKPVDVDDNYPPPAPHNTGSFLLDEQDSVQHASLVADWPWLNSQESCSSEERLSLIHI
eukprot:TRINITY_DN227_c0_g1_i4.p1 TRINITY_DN227_c0_g1~~TRINITY_DN227_c0_g1_i4.p1  ORF type:complete len:122 (+),score=10.31 TRINITY_DN227_c0_g1_i4:150-515(+)